MMWIAQDTRQHVENAAGVLSVAIKPIRARIAGRIGVVENRRCPGINFAKYMAVLIPARDIMAMDVVL